MPPSAQFLPANLRWIAWIEKAGTVGVCIWMLFWFQTQTDRQHRELMTVTQQVVSAMQADAVSKSELASAVRGLQFIVESRHQ